MYNKTATSKSFHIKLNEIIGLVSNNLIKTSNAKLNQLTREWGNNLEAGSLSDRQTDRKICGIM